MDFLENIAMYQFEFPASQCQRVSTAALPYITQFKVTANHNKSSNFFRT